MKPTFFNITVLLLLTCAGVFIIYRTGYSYGYVQGHRENEHYYNGADMGHTIEEIVHIYRSAEDSNKTNAMRGCCLLLRKYVSRYQTILGGRDPGDYFRETWNEARRIASDDRFDK